MNYFSCLYLILQKFLLLLMSYSSMIETKMIIKFQCFLSLSTVFFFFLLISTMNSKSTKMSGRWVMGVRAGVVFILENTVIDSVKGGPGTAPNLP